VPVALTLKLAALQPPRSDRAAVKQSPARRSSDALAKTIRIHNRLNLSLAERSRIQRHLIHCAAVIVRMSEPIACPGKIVRRLRVKETEILAISNARYIENP